ncbi:uncharacterized protein LOC124691490 [Lolium rigidum]|uniref:uncharacterized protein LOC124691490 n=1 Tax=Lolium rigidum TaxID=89674 RepID=UPI001F5D85F5|nr:uncharacterized protein LOC124691490 [Lolium rigidum]XP_047080724.1 uncharacterized protein LOC124691490 [Lolium rigidum]XP_047080725.1 uncharacterized protein LOC124691490 [Lolium rigidum]
MLRLRTSTLAHLLSTSCPYISSLHRLLSAAAANPSFAIGDYLVETCGLTRAQADKASAKVSHLKSPSKPDAVLAFLAGLGVSSADVAPLVARDPEFLCARVDKTLAPNVADLTGLGLSRAEMARLASLDPERFRSRSIVSKLRYYLPLFGSCDNLFRALKHGSYLLGTNLEQVVMPNVVFLRQCGLSDCDIAKLCIYVPRMMTGKPERVQEMAVHAEGLGVPRGSGMFREALQAVAFLSQEKITARMDYLKKTFRWSDAQVSIALKKAPTLIRRSQHMLRRKSEFLISEVGLEPVYIAHRPAMIWLSLEGRLRPRHYVLKFLKENGIHDWSFFGAVLRTNDVFMEKYICPHKEVAPHLAEDYAAACRGEVPTNFRFTSTKVGL